MAEAVAHRSSVERYEVFFQNHPNEAVDRNVVSSREEAEQAVLDFYNHLIANSFRQVSPLVSFDEIDMFKSQYAKDIPGRAWFVAMEPPTPSVQPVPGEFGEGEHFKFDFPNVHSNYYDLFNHLTRNLSQGLREEGISLSAAKVHQVVSKAFWSSFPEGNLLPETEVMAKEEEDSWILLVFVGQAEAAVYYGDEYIDSASRNQGEDLQIIVDTAHALAEKYHLGLKTHQFKSMVHDWSWTRIEQILKSTGLMPSHRKNFLALLLENHPEITMNNVRVKDYQLDQNALRVFTESGDGSQDFLVIYVAREHKEYSVVLTIDEVVKAVEISPRHWVCADATSTEIIVKS